MHCIVGSVSPQSPSSSSAWHEHQACQGWVTECLFSGDAEMADLAREEIDGLTQSTDKLIAEIKLLLLPRDPLDDKNIMLEVRASLCMLLHLEEAKGGVAQG